MNKFKGVHVDPCWHKRLEGDRVVTNKSLIDMGSVFEPLVHSDSLMFLWVPDQMIMQAPEIMEAWGFDYCTVGFTWVRLGNEVPFPLGGGYWTRTNPQICLLGKRGKPNLGRKDVSQLIIEQAPSDGTKPKSARERITKIVNGPYLDVFARNPDPGWWTWSFLKETAA